MRIEKRDGRLVPLSTDRVLYRLQKLCQDQQLGPLKNIDSDALGLKVITRIFDGIKSSALDEFAAQLATEMSTVHPEYGTLASRIIISNMHKNTVECFSDVMNSLYNNKDTNGDPSPLLSDETIAIIKNHKNILNLSIRYSEDYRFDYFGFKTLEKGYLMKQYDSNGVQKPVERPQHMYMRVAIGIHGDNIEKILETYELLSKGLFTHATPTLFNAGTRIPQMSSCFLITLSEDSVKGIFSTLGKVADISKVAGGIGFSCHNLRGKDSIIRGTNGKSDGLIPFLKVYNETFNYINQGGRRKGSGAIYLEPWHNDIYDFLGMKKKHGNLKMLANDLFYALWIPDYFMKCVIENTDWYLMCPDQSPGLFDLYGDEFEQKYKEYIDAKRYTKKIRAQDLWKRILDIQMETSGPYMLYKDSANRKSNQKNLGTIRSSNLCTEIIEYSSPTETAVCNLASIALPKYIINKDGKKSFDHDLLYQVTKTITKNLNRVIDRNFYPTPETQLSNLRHRPVGLGVQGLADTYIIMRYPFDSKEAAQLNKEIFETIYYAAVTSSMEEARDLAQELSDLGLKERQLPNLCDEALELAKKDGKNIMEDGKYSSYYGSPISEGKFQFDLWHKIPESEVLNSPGFGRWDWNLLRKEVLKYGVRNSLLVAPMPTASTGQILGNNASIEPFTSNLYKRSTLSGSFKVTNNYLVHDLLDRGLWNNNIKDQIILYDGSIQKIDGIPDDIKKLYKTAYELKQKVLLDQAADRGIYIDQSQSLNIFMDDPNYSKLSSLHKYAWELGLKTGMYYLHTGTTRSAVKVTLDPNLEKQLQAEKELVSEIEYDEVCRMEEGCISCGS